LFPEPIFVFLFPELLTLLLFDDMEDFDGIDFEGVDLEGADLEGADFPEAGKPFFACAFIF
jgi:hypothetical protein